MRKDVYIIAEAGVNHNGNYDQAVKLIAEAARAGANAIKFQTFKPCSLVSKYAKTAEYQCKNTKGETDQLAMLNKLQLPYEWHQGLFDRCKELGIAFSSSAFDMESIGFLSKFDIPFWKIPSGEIDNLPYLIKIARTNKPVILSTGMCTIDEVKYAVDVLREYGTSDLTLLHCTTEYPTAFRDVNLLALLELKKEFGVDVGYSDHTMGIEVPIAATVLGATVIEKHFTLDKKMPGPDHKASMEPNEFAEMVQAVRNVQEILGNSQKQPVESELKNKLLVRKSIVAKNDIHEGELFSEDNLTVKRPGTGISPSNWFEVLGQRAKRKFKQDENVEI